MLIPLVGDAATERGHVAHDFDLSDQRRSRGAGKPGELVPEHDAEPLALLGHDLDAVGVQQLIVAECRRYRVRSRPILFETGLGIVFAVTADLERVDANCLLAREPGRAGDFGVGPFEVDLARGPGRHEPIFLERMPQKISHNGQGWSGWQVVELFGRRNRPCRAAVERRLRQHIVFRYDRLTADDAWRCASGASAGPDPNRRRNLFKRLTRRLVGGELAKVVRLCVRDDERRRRIARGSRFRAGRRRKPGQSRCNESRSHRTEMPCHRIPSTRISAL